MLKQAPCKNPWANMLEEEHISSIYYVLYLLSIDGWWFYFWYSVCDVESRQKLQKWLKTEFFSLMHFHLDRNSEILKHIKSMMFVCLYYNTLHTNSWKCMLKQHPYQWFLIFIISFCSPTQSHFRFIYQLKFDLYIIYVFSF